MLNFCLSPEKVNKVKEIISQTVKDSSGAEKPISTESRLKQLGDVIKNKEELLQFNNGFEKATLLKNKEAAINKYVDSFLESNIKDISKRTKAKAELSAKIKQRLSDRSAKIQNDELLGIAQDLYNRKYKLDIPLEDIKAINDQKIIIDSLDNAKGRMLDKTGGSAYGDAVVNLDHTIQDLKNPSSNYFNVQKGEKGFNADLKRTGNIIADTFQSAASRFSKEQGVLGNIGAAARLLGDVATSAIYKSIQASADLSYGLRQGFKVLTTDIGNKAEWVAKGRTGETPKSIWVNNWKAAFEPFTKFRSKEAQQLIADKFVSRMVSNPLYETAMRAKLALGVVEDYFPTSIADEIPLLGSIFKASNEAFTIFSQGSRMGLFEDMYSRALERGPVTDEIAKNIAYVANSISGRGSLGNLEKVGSTVNKIVYSGRYISSSIDTFSMPFKKSLDPFTRQEALKSSISTLATMGSLLYTASLFTKVEWNPLSSKFGKFKVPGSKDTWVDLTAGLGSYITFAAKQALSKTKSTTTGKITQLNARDKNGNLVYGGQTRYDAALDWFTNKLSPAPSAIAQFEKGSGYNGKKPTIGSSALNIITPISAGNAMQQILSSNNDTLSKFISSVADLNGLNQTDYTQFQKKK